MSILIELRLSCFPTNIGSEKSEIRIQQFINGLKKFFNYLPLIYKNHTIDILVTDNTVNNKLPDNIINILPENIIIRTCMNNNYGCINKGAGDIEQWLYNRDLIQKYDWFIHFEPRQLLKSNQFIESFLKCPRNLFTININVKHFNTGLFCIKSEVLLNYIDNIDLKTMIIKYISIEDDLYKYFIVNNIKFDTLEKMDLIWYPYNHEPLHM